MDFAYDSPTPILKCIFFCIATFEIFFNVGCEASIMYLVSKYTAKDIATRLKDANCFSVGMGSDTVTNVQTKIDAVVVFGIIELSLSAASAVAQAVTLKGEWKWVVGDSQEQADGAATPGSRRRRIAIPMSR